MRASRLVERVGHTSRGERRGSRALQRRLRSAPELYDGKVLAQASDSDEELVTGEIDPEAARVTHVRRRPGEHEWDTIADRRPGLYERLLQPGVDREHPPSANLFSGDVD